MRTSPAAPVSARRKPIDTTDVAGQLRLSVTRLGRILRHQDPAGLSPTLTSALATLGRAGPLTLGELAAREHVTPPTVTRAVDKLEAQGLVVRKPDPHDGRVVRVVVTGAGRGRIADARARRTAWLADRLATLSAPELEHVAAAAEILARLTEGAER
jgi:DNA-binding MarR family transcriptional regulator